MLARETRNLKPETCYAHGEFDVSTAPKGPLFPGAVSEKA